MAEIIITITESGDELIAGIPRSIILSTDIPSTIFYTLDGSTPDINSHVYISAIIPSGNTLSLKVFATNGIDSSQVISKEYSINILKDNTRVPHAGIKGAPSGIKNMSQFPFGSPGSGGVTNETYTASASVGTTVDSPTIHGIPYGFGSPAETDLPDPNMNYLVEFSESDKNNQYSQTTGTLPAKVKVIQGQHPVEYTVQSSNTSSKLFNPKAMVIYQDAQNDNPSEPVQINRTHFMLENPTLTRDGNLLFNCQTDNQGPNGSFLRSHYNPRTHEITYYYFDSSVNRWIISKTLYEPKNSDAGNLSGMVFSRPNDSVGVVYKWIPGLYRVLT